VKIGDDVTSGRITVPNQKSFTTIEISRGRTPTDMHELLRAVCGDSTSDRSTQFHVGPTDFVKARTVLKTRKSVTENISVAIIAAILEEDL
jgi:hypothetical protein